MSDGEPIAYQALAKGAEVRCSDGTTIGTVEHVLAEPDLDLFDGLAVSTHDGLRFVDRDQIASINTRAVTTTLTPSEAAELPKPEGEQMYHADPTQDEGSALTARFGRMFGRAHWTRDS